MLWDALGMLVSCFFCKQVVIRLIHRCFGNNANWCARMMLLAQLETTLSNESALSPFQNVQAEMEIPHSKLPNDMITSYSPVIAAGHEETTCYVEDMTVIIKLFLGIFQHVVPRISHWQS